MAAGAEGGVQGAYQAWAGVPARDDERDDEHQQHARPQAPGIVAGDVGARQANPESPDHRRHAFLVPSPQRFRQPIGATRGQAVFQGGERMVGEVVVALQPRTGRLMADFAKTRRCPQDRGDEPDREQGEDTGMQPVGQDRQDIEQGQRKERAEHASGRPQPRPKLLPQQRGRCERQQATIAPVAAPVVRAGRHGGHRPRAATAGLSVSSRRASHGGRCCRASMSATVTRPWTMAQLALSTRTSGASGRAL